MDISRRRAIRRLLVGGAAGALGSRIDASYGDTAQYTYDSQGRLVRVAFSGGAKILYAYDLAGNRTVAFSPPAGAFGEIIDITSSGPVNLRTLANGAGYNGAQNATVYFLLGVGMTITGAAAGGMAIDTGTWPTGSYAIDLELHVWGRAIGGGGTGGNGGSGSAAGQAGASGGDAIYCRTPIDILVNPTAEVKAGGGGGGGGAGTQFYAYPYGWQTRGGGGGGGGFPNGAGGAGGSGSSGNGLPGAAGTTSGGGAGGLGGGPPGGAGGNSGAAGIAGTNGSNASGGAGGVAGYAIRKNGHNVVVTNNNGAITGTVA